MGAMLCAMADACTRLEAFQPRSSAADSCPPPQTPCGCGARPLWACVHGSVALASAGRGRCSAGCVCLPLGSVVCARVHQALVAVLAPGLSALAGMAALAALPARRPGAAASAGGALAALALPSRAAAAATLFFAVGAAPGCGRARVVPAARHLLGRSVVNGGHDLANPHALAPDQQQLSCQLGTGHDRPQAGDFCPAGQVAFNVLQSNGCSPLTAATFGGYALSIKIRKEARVPHVFMSLLAPET